MVLDDVILETETGLGPFSIVPKVYEAALDDKYGITLGEIRNRQFLDNPQFKENLSFGGGKSDSAQRVKELILDKLEDVPGYCSMKLKNYDDLLDHVKRIHEVSYNHYAWAKEEDLRCTFPKGCCGISSENLFLTLLEKGYANATFIGLAHTDHAYVALPFVLEETGEQGFVIVDPTSDQCHDKKEAPPRNHVFVSFGDEWEYKTDWQEGEDMFPTKCNGGMYNNLETLRKYRGELLVHDIPPTYFNSVFENPVEVDIKDL